MLVAKRRTPEDLELLSLSVREAGRRWLVGHEMHDLLSLERPLLPGEPDEPIGGNRQFGVSSITAYYRIHIAVLADACSK